MSVKNILFTRNLAYSYLLLDPFLPSLLTKPSSLLFSYITMPFTKIMDLCQVLIVKYCSLVALLLLLFTQTIYLMNGTMLP